MPAFDDDDLQNFEEARPSRRDRDDHSWNVDDEGPDDRDLVPDEFTTVRCTNCRKLIFEDSMRCPYCRHLQLEEERGRKPLWFIATVIICIGIMMGFAATYALGMWPF